MVPVSQHKLDYDFLFKIWLILLAFEHIVGTGFVILFFYYGQPILNWFRVISLLVFTELCWFPTLRICKTYYVLSQVISPPKIFSSTQIVIRGKELLVTHVNIVGNPFTVYVKQRALQTVTISKCSLQLVRYHHYKQGKLTSHVLHSTTLAKDLPISQFDSMNQFVQLTIPVSEPVTTKDRYICPRDAWFLILTTTVANESFEQVIKIIVE
jgi:hypothetical protein